MNTENVAVQHLFAGAPALSAPPSALKLELRLYGDVVLLRCRGRLVYRQNTAELTSIVSDLLCMTRRLLVDLTHVDRIDSAGLCELVTLYMWSVGHGHSIAFLCPNQRVHKVLDLTNLTSLFEIHDNLDDGIRALHS